MEVDDCTDQMVRHNVPVERDGATEAFDDNEDEDAVVLGNDLEGLLDFHCNMDVVVHGGEDMTQMAELFLHCAYQDD